MKSNVSNSVKTKQEKAATYDLFAATRTENIGVAEKNAHNTSVKEIAAMVRAHIKSRFKMCKFSVRSDYHHIDIDLLASPFEKDSDELNAIVHYVYVFTQSYNYDNSDSMTDYFEVGFYGVYESSIVPYNYQQTEMTQEIQEVIDLFKSRKAADDKAKEAEAAAKEAEYMAQLEAQEKEFARIEEQTNKNITAIEASVQIEDCTPFFIRGMREPNMNKLATLDEVIAQCIKEDGYQDKICQITRKVFMDEESWNLFKNMFMCGFTFLDGFGGEATDDYRVGSIEDYHRMEPDERYTVEWYVHDAVAVYVGNELKCVVNPEGYDYGRYVLVNIDEPVEILETYDCKQVLTQEEHESNKEIANGLMDASSKIIEENKLGVDWNGAYYDEWVGCMVRFIESNDIDFNVNVIRAIGENHIPFKSGLYRVLDEMESLYHQFIKADLQDGQKVTLIYIGDFGGVSTSHVTIRDVDYGQYAQYEKAIKITHRPRDKRGDYYQWFYRDILVFDGWVEFPLDVLWEISKNNGITTRKSRFTSCDTRQYTAILDYFNSVGISPIIKKIKNN